LDFFNGCNFEVLRVANGIGHGDCFKLLKDFYIILENIYKIMEKYSRKKDDNVVRTFKNLKDLFKKELDKYII